MASVLALWAPVSGGFEEASAWDRCAQWSIFHCGQAQDAWGSGEIEDFIHVHGIDDEFFLLHPK